MKKIATLFYSLNFSGYVKMQLIPTHILFQRDSLNEYTWSYLIQDLARNKRYTGWRYNDIRCVLSLLTGLSRTDKNTVVI
jgi:hypothetical protein